MTGSDKAASPVSRHEGAFAASLGVGVDALRRRLAWGEAVERTSRIIDTAEARIRTSQIVDRRATVERLVVACGRMRDHWAEADEAVRQSLWRAVHTAADEADEAYGIYPLRGQENTDSPVAS